MAFNYRQLKAIQKINKIKLQKTNPYLDEKSGIYILTREDERGFKFAYIGQAEHILSRLEQHLREHKQHIDNSLSTHGLYSVENIYGWKIGFIHYPKERLDEMEQYHIKEYADYGYQLHNKTIGGQGVGKTQLHEYKPAKGYYDGIKQGKKSLAKELSSIIEKHLEINLKESKKDNKVSQKMFDKFKELLLEDTYKD